MNNIIDIDLSDIESSPNRLRTDTQSNIEELSLSIKDVGVINPILIRESDEGYIIVSGERRFKAFQLLSKKTIPCRIVSSDVDSTALSLVENIQRKSLTTLEESKAILSLIKTLKKGYKELGRLIGKNEDYVENRVRFYRIHTALKNRIAPFTQDKSFLRKVDKLSLSKVLAIRPLTSHWNEKECYDLLCRIVDEQMTLREIKDELTAYNEKKIMRKMSQNDRTEREALKFFDELMGESKTGVKLTSKRGIKKNMKLTLDNDFWEKLTILFHSRLNVKIKEIVLFEKGLQRIIRKYGEIININS